MLSNLAVGPGHPTLIIAEVAQAHDGSLGFAHAFIDAAAEAGVDAIKFQTHIASEESTLDEPFRVRFSDQDETRYAYWRRMEFAADEWAALAKHAEARGLMFLSSAFSVAAVTLLDKLGVPAWKIASGEVASRDLLQAMAGTGKPLLISTGMSPWQEIDDIVDYARGQELAFAVFQCTSAYPTSLDRVGLNVLDQLRDRYGCPVGLSDHSGSMWPGIVAMARGVDLLELHITLDRRMFGPDVAVSLTPDELAKVVAARDAIGLMDASPVDKDAMADGLSGMRGMFGKSLAARSELPAGTVLTADMLTAKKPATGIRPSELNAVIGRRLLNDVQPDRVLRWQDVSDG